MAEDIRWIQRFENFKKAYITLNKITKSTICIDDLSDLEIDGVIQRFEFTFELSWKTLQDYLLFLGFEFQTGPNTTLKLSAENSLISDLEVWRKMAKARNLTTHIYDEQVSRKIAHEIFDIYVDKLNELILFLDSKKQNIEKESL